MHTHAFAGVICCEGKPMQVSTKCYPILGREQCRKACAGKKHPIWTHCMQTFSCRPVQAKCPLPPKMANRQRFAGRLVQAKCIKNDRYACKQAAFSEMQFHELLRVDLARVVSCNSLNCS